MKRNEPIKLKKLLHAAEALARLHRDGHFTIMRFTTGWKAVWGTPNIEEKDREYIAQLKNRDDIQGALLDLFKLGIGETKP